MEQRSKAWRWMRTGVVLALVAACPPGPDAWSQEGPSGSAPPSVAAPQGQPASSEDSQGVIIRSFEFVGNSHYTDKVLQQRLGIELGERCDPFLAGQGRWTILKVYRDVGYPFVEVTLDVDQVRQGRLMYTITEGPRVKIEAIRFAGNKAFGAATLRGLLKTKQRSWLVRPGYYSEQSVLDDVERLRTFYWANGYLGYDVQVQTAFAQDRSGVTVTFQIDEGPVYRVSQVVLTGNVLVPADRLWPLVGRVEGQVYKRDKVDLGVRRILELYQEQGFIEAEVVHTPKLGPDTRDDRVTVEIAIREGRQFRIGRIEVAGNETTQDKTVRRVLDEYGFTPGQLYNTKVAPVQGSGLLERYVRRFSMAEQVLIRPEPAASGDPNQRDVRVDLTEGMTGMIIPGVGVSSDHGVVAQLIYQQHNFDITDWPQSWSEFFQMQAFRGGGQTLQVALEPGTKVSRYSIDFTEPYFMDRPVGLDLTGRKYERYLESYDEERLSGLVEFEHRRRSGWRTILGFRGENVGVEDLDGDAPAEIREVAGDSALFGLKLGLGLSRVDDLYRPHSGHILRGAYEQVTGDFTFGIVTATAVKYLTLREDVLGHKTVLAAKVQGGAIVGDAPPFEKFYGGGMGQYAIRGFAYRGMSTLGLQVFDPPEPGDPPLPEPRYVDPIGSDFVVVGNVEVVVPLIGEDFAAVTFADTGIVDTGGWRFS
ncbi:MAG: BamA/TamA family outer membrane protein, partial [Phycisphaerae bacterium]|nr:BamA/TamA family outer membrane protein [Phycisphaerae bacterium]